MNLHLDPDFVLSVRVEDLGDPKALSNTARVSIDIMQNLWFSPGPITIKENLDEEYPMYLTTVSLDLNKMLSYGRQCLYYLKITLFIFILII